jgi:hypothetical protein
MSGKNTIVREVGRKSIFESAINVISSAVSINQGDLVVFDDTANLLKLPSAETEGSTFLGVMMVSIASGKLIGPYTGIPDAVTTAGINDVPGPAYGVVAKCVAKTGIALAPGDSIYLDPATGTRGVTNTGTKIIGIYQGATVASASAGQEIEVLLGSRHNGDTLKY